MQIKFGSHIVYPIWIEQKVQKRATKLIPVCEKICHTSNASDYLNFQTRKVSK